MRQLEPDVVRLVLEGGGDLIVLDFIVLVVGERGPEADLLDPGDRVTVLAANVDAVAAQIHERHLVMPMIVIVIVIVIVIAVMAPAMQRRAVRMAVFEFVVVAGQAILAALAGVGGAEVAVSEDYRAAGAEGRGIVERAVTSALAE